MKINSRETRNSRAANLGSEFYDIPKAKLGKMLNATLKKEYTPNWKRIIIITLIALVYIISPYDLIPEVVLSFIGCADDIAVFVLIIKYLINRELDDYSEWVYSNNIGAKRQNELVG